MPKRKRDGEWEPPSKETQTEPGISMRQHRVEAKINNGHKLLNRAFKTAKGFERQKLGRRRKTAISKSDAKDVARIDAETAAIKTLDFSAAARTYLHKSLLKIKSVAESPDLPTAVSKATQQPLDTATVNVVARLCNSNPVKEALPPIIREIQKALGVDVSKNAPKGKETRKKALPKQSSPTSGLDLSDNFDDSSDPGSENETTVSRRTYPIDDSDGSGDENAMENDSEDEFAQFDGRLAGSSASDSDSEGNSEDAAFPRRSSISRAQALRAAMMEASASPSASPSPEPERAPQTRTMTRPTKSAFVPSLTMGGYWSGSESEPEMDVDIAPRKNRRGQRARQAIAEKKFGSRAKHLQKQQAHGQKDRNSGWDAKRGATDGPRHRGRGVAPARSGDNNARDRGADRGITSAPPKKKHRDDEGPIHPSWEAAKKAKEAKATAPFQGKKITFD
ncbi:hypothetical protein MBLNU459_g8430t1 [Dothideomycetes sp. NU459]